MTKKEKDILLKDLCARLPYGVIVHSKDLNHGTEADTKLSPIDSWVFFNRVEAKPYLRPMSSMTEEEYKELKEIEPYYGIAPFNLINDWAPNYEAIDWLNKHHFDYRGLIPMGLALAAPKGMYKI